RAVFLYGFAKNERENIGTDRLRDFRSIGQALLRATEKEIEAAIEAGELTEANDGETEKKT
ncbi:MAG: type II toxin-antitoxin system RelE/ParE family toxin, partial [Hyphomicrobiaceae bacterium]